MSDATDFWDDEEIQVTNLVQLDKKGDHVSGIILKLQKEMFGGALSREGGPVRTIPQLVIMSDEDNEEWVLNAGAIELRKKLQDARPAVGDHIRVEMTGTTKLENRPSDKFGKDKVQKHYEVVITKNN